MRIPEKVKIGGLTYKVEITDNLECGRNGNTGEINYRDCVIRIVPGPKQRMEETLCHEIVHALFSGMGWYDDDDNESRVQALSHAVHTLIADNSDMFKPEDNDGTN